MRDLVALRRFLEEREAVPFGWGRDANDCGAFILAGAQAQTGRDPMPGRRWSSARGAARLIARAGGMEALVDSVFRPIPLARAGRGDIAGLADGAFGILLMFVDGDLLIGPGATRAPRSAMIRAWSVEP